jgi:hypothetical protein
LINLKKRKKYSYLTPVISWQSNSISFKSLDSHLLQFKSFHFYCPILLLPRLSFHLISFHLTWFELTWSDLIWFDWSRVRDWWFLTNCNGSWFRIFQIVSRLKKKL